MLSAIILAAGTSSRMGDINKLLLPYLGRPIIRHVVDEVVATGIKQVIVVLGYEAERVKTALQPLPVDFVINRNYLQGMTSSIKTGVSSAHGDGYMICLGDMYAIRASEYRLLAEVFERNVATDNSCICIPVFEAKKGNPVIFSRTYREQILQHDNPEGCREIVLRNADRVQYVLMPSSHILQDLDLPQHFADLHEGGDP